MNVVNNMRTGKDYNKYQTTKVVYDQNSISIIYKIITKSKLHQIKSKRNILTYTSLKNMEPVLNETKSLIGRPKRAKRCEVQKYVSIFEKN